MRTFFTLICINFIFYFVGGKKVIMCGDSCVTNITLNKNEIVFIESYKFSNPMSTDFTLNVFGKYIEQEEAMLLSIGLTSGDLGHTCFLFDGLQGVFTFSVPYVYNTNSSFLNFTCNPGSLEDTMAFQGFISYEKNYTNGCSMLNIAKPLFLVDETEVVSIKASAYSTKRIQCLWNFIAPKDFGFKFTSLAELHKATLIVKNSTNYIITDIFTQSNLPYYNVDHNITVTFEIQPGSTCFPALISLVKKDPIREIDNCVIEEQNGYRTWSTSFYSNNAICNFTIKIKPHQQLFISYRSIVTEPEFFADIITVTVNDDLDNRIIFTALDDISVFGPNENGTTKTLYWEFLSDGSIVTRGFVFDYILYDCNCSESLIVVPCEGIYYYNIMNTSSIFEEDYTNFYCANMKCIFTITINVTCSEKYIFAYLDLFDGTYGNSTFKLTSNDETYAELSACQPSGFGYIKPNSLTTLEFNSGKDLENGTFEMSFQAYNKYTILPKIVLTCNNPVVALDSFLWQINTVLPVELSDELKRNNDSLQLNYSLYFIFFENIQLYSDVNLTHILPNDISRLNLTSFVILTLINDEEHSIRLIVSAKKVSSENCLFDDTLFYIYLGDEPIYRKAKYGVLRGEEDKWGQLTLFSDYGV